MDIRITNLTKAFGGKQVLKSFNGVFKEGAVTAVMAPSGAGKTTLLRILTGLEKADGGSVEGLTGRRIGMVFQEDRLCEALSAVTNIRLVCDKSVTVSQIERELARIGLAGSERQPVGELSGGMRRRVVLLRALLSPCELLILDEPFQGLDGENRKAAMDYTRERSRGKTVILVTHDEREAEYMAESILFLDISRP